MLLGTSVRLDASNLAALARGCAVLGGGGGGSPELGLIMALRALDEHGPVELVQLEELDDDELVMPCGMLGAPTLATERIFSGDEGSLLRNVVEELHGIRVEALMCFQIGGLNGLLPVTWAARAGVRLVDADGMGRTFARLDRQAMRLAGVPASPVFVTDGRGNVAVLRGADDGWARRLARGAASTLGGVAAVALYCMPGQVAREAAIPRSVSRAVALGGALARRGFHTRLHGVCESLDAVPLLRGRVSDVGRRVEDGIARGAVTVRGTGRDSTRELRLELQGEVLVALEDGAVRAAVPDLICVLTTDTGEPLGTELLRFGQEVVVVAAPAASVWLTEAGLALAGPRSFGYDLDYAPIGVEADGQPG
jgi:uncharacterized protein